MPFPLELAAIDADSLPTRRTLLSRLRNLGDDASWRVFFDTYWRLIYNVARKSGLSDGDAQDVVQDTVIAVARKMPGFHYDPAKGSFKQWLLLITRRRIQDHLRRVFLALAGAGWPGLAGGRATARGNDGARGGTACGFAAAGRGHRSGVGGGMAREHLRS